MRPLIEAAAARHELPAALIAAMVEVESSGNPYAWNPEPHYRYLWDVRRNRPFRALNAAEIGNERPPADFPFLGGDRDQEWWAQQASWGLLQVMGAVARECGHHGPYLTSLCNAELGLEYGCMHLSNLRRRYKRVAGWDAVIAAYNAGSPRYTSGEAFVNQAYVDKVRKALNGAELS